MASKIINKACITCKEIKDISQFLFRVESGTYRKQCRACLNAQSIARIQAAPKASRRERYLRQVYGITTEDFTRLWEQQKGLCALCGGQGNPRRGLVVDHCHATGLIRGLLCETCNGALGAFGDNLEGIQKAVDYLIRAQTEGMQPTVIKLDKTPKKPRIKKVGSQLSQSLLTEEKVQEIRKLHEQGYAQSAIAGQYGVSIATISNVVRRKGWTHVE